VLGTDWCRQKATVGKKISQKQRAGQDNSCLMFIILLQMVTNQLLISRMQHSKDKCAINEKYIFLYAEAAIFFTMGLLRMQRWNCS